MAGHWYHKPATPNSSSNIVRHLREALAVFSSKKQDWRLKWQDVITKQCSCLPVVLSGNGTTAETRQIQGQREKNVAGHKQAQAELPLSLAVLAFLQRCSLKPKLSLMTPETKFKVHSDLCCCGKAWISLPRLEVELGLGVPCTSARVALASPPHGPTCSAEMSQRPGTGWTSVGEELHFP